VFFDHLKIHGPFILTDDGTFWTGTPPSKLKKIPNKLNVSPEGLYEHGGTIALWTIYEDGVAEVTRKKPRKVKLKEKKVRKEERKEKKRKILRITIAAIKI